MGLMQAHNSHGSPPNTKVKISPGKVFRNHRSSCSGVTCTVQPKPDHQVTLLLLFAPCKLLKRQRYNKNCELRCELKFIYPELGENVHNHNCISLNTLERTSFTYSSLAFKQQTPLCHFVNVKATLDADCWSGALLK